MPFFWFKCVPVLIYKDNERIGMLREEFFIMHFFK